MIIDCTSMHWLNPSKTIGEKEDAGNGCCCPFTEYQKSIIMRAIRIPINAMTLPVYWLRV